jgi:hypothetical protein
MAIKVSGTTVINDSRELTNITDMNNVVRTPSWSSPADGTTDAGAGRTLRVQLSQFEAVFGVNSQLQIQLDNNSDFSSPIYDETLTTSNRYHDIDGIDSSIPTSTLLYARGRYYDAESTASNWSPTASFTTRSGFDTVSTPSITSPSNGATQISYSGGSYTITSSAFATSGGSYTHSMSDWQIATDAGFTLIAAQSLDDVINKTTWSPTTTLNPGSVYYVRVKHNNTTLGDSEWSSVVQFTTAIPSGEDVYTTPGTYSWTCPVGVTEVSALAVGGGGGGANSHDGHGGQGGSTYYKNSITVTPASNYTVVVGSGGMSQNSWPGSYAQGASGDESFFSTFVRGNGGIGGGSPSSPRHGTPTSASGNIGDGGGLGGYPQYLKTGGSGAGGYSGMGGIGTGSQGSTGSQPTGGGGGGGNNAENNYGAGGGGVGLFGTGTNGVTTTVNATTTGQVIAGTGGSGGQSGFFTPQGNVGHGGAYGGAGGPGSSQNSQRGGNGGHGAVRIIWGGGRSYPSNAS